MLVKMSTEGDERFTIFIWVLIVSHLLLPLCPTRHEIAEEMGETSVLKPSLPSCALLSQPPRHAAMIRARPAVVLRERVAAVSALCRGAGWHTRILRSHRSMHANTIHVPVVGGSTSSFVLRELCRSRWRRWFWLSLRKSGKRKRDGQQHPKKPFHFLPPETPNRESTG